MDYGIFCDRKNLPAENQIEETVGTRLEQWKELNSYLLDEIKAASSFKFYEKNYGWACGYSKKGRSIVALYPLLNDFTIQIILNNRQVSEVMKVVNNIELKGIINETPEIHEGKWIFFKYSLVDSCELIKKLIEIRMQFN